MWPMGSTFKKKKSELPATNLLPAAPVLTWPCLLLLCRYRMGPHCQHAPNLVVRVVCTHTCRGLVVQQIHLLYWPRKFKFQGVSLPSVIFRGKVIFRATFHVCLHRRGHPRELHVRPLYRPLYRVNVLPSCTA